MEGNSVAASFSSLRIAWFISLISSRNVSIEVREVRVSSVLEFSLHCSISSSILLTVLYMVSFTVRSPKGVPCVLQLNSRLSHARMESIFLRLPYDSLLLGAAACFPGLAQLMEIVESLFYGYMIEHIDLLRQNRLSHTTFVFHDDANAKNGGPDYNGEEDIKITLVLFLMHSADPDGGSRTGIKIAGFDQFDYPLPCSFIVLQSLMSHCSRRVSTCIDERRPLDTDIKASFFLKKTRSGVRNVVWNKIEKIIMKFITS